MSYGKGDVILPEQAMKLALTEAQRGFGYVSPNPAVGCVLVDAQHKFLSSGFHSHFGGDHAELSAIKKISAEECIGGTAYVTLEPCSHQGKTPPCAPAMVKLKLSKLVCGLKDPNPIVSGRGFEVLRQAGVEIEMPMEFRSACEKLTAVFLYNMKFNLPFVALKIASTIDGKITDETTPWITGEEARREGRRLRAHYDATLIGARTLLNDNPILDFRDTEFADKKQNKIIIWDPKGLSFDFLPTSKLHLHHKPDNIFILTQNPKQSPYQVYKMEQTEITNTELIWLYGKGVYSMYVEGGAKTVKQFMDRQLYQKLYLFVSEKDKVKGLSWIDSMQDILKDKSEFLKLEDVQSIGGDKLYLFYKR